ncbi:ISL3 family transposase [Patescibacteria group bacterium]|nr:MAG: ISL3 family transposase [Patescibacteria group bacterium]
MDQETLFTLALGLTSPWEVRNIRFSSEDRRLDIFVGFPRGSLFTCPVCGSKGAKAWDTAEKSWRHLNFFQHEAWITASVPRVKCDQGCGVKKIEVPWARSGSGFTLLFEAMIMIMAREMPVAQVAEIMDVHDTRLWRTLHHYVDEARSHLDLSEVKRVGMDETASRRGHHYISLFFDMDESQLLFATQGKDKETVDAFAKDLTAHKGRPKSVLQVCCDMSPAFISGVKAQFPDAEITFDRFHIMKIVNDAVDQVRREEATTQPLLAKTRYIWLKNPGNLTAKQQSTMNSLKNHKLKTARAYQIRLTLQDFFRLPTRQEGEAFLKRWYFWATHSRLPPIVAAAKTIKNHWDGVLNWFDSRLTTGLVEGFNSLLQAAKARARGYRSTANFITMAYLIGSQLNFSLPT